MKKRGGYAGNLAHQIKVRVSSDMYGRLQRLSEVKQITIARVIRNFISSGLREGDTS
jgi:predicted DNA-binding protein